MGFDLTEKIWWTIMRFLKSYELCFRFHPAFLSK